MVTVDQADIADPAHDLEWQVEAHADHRDQDTYRQEHLLPEGVHLRQMRGVDGRVVETYCNFNRR
ncbi:hypothetical protein D3C73_1576880 [compost metagenome]